MRLNCLNQVTAKNNTPATPATYKDAGVDIEAGNALVERIKPLARTTQRSGVTSAIGGFGALFDLKAAGFKDPVLVSSTDGVGTKIKLAIDCDAHDTIGIDLVAMCVNDLVVQGAEPLFFLDYFATGKLDTDTATKVIAGIARGCEQAGCALIGGETAEMPGMYAPGDYDLAGFAVGAAERGELLPSEEIGEGDVLLGLASTGIHSNGYSLVRRLVEQSGLEWGEGAPFDGSRTLLQAFIEPTRIYVQSCLKTIAATGAVRALAHITGGGLTENLPRVLPEHLSAEIELDSWKLPPIFHWLRERGAMEDAELLRTFNCGIGMIAVVPAAQAEHVADVFRQQGETVFTIGTLIGKQAARVTYRGSL